MPSREYFAELSPDLQPGRWLVGSALLALGAGLCTIWQLPISVELRWLGGIGWTLAAAGRSWPICAVQSQWRQLRISADGSVVVVTPDGNEIDASMTGNCVVLARLAWLDLKSASGPRFCALVRGNARESEQWRRFQVIWRHMGSGP